MSGEERSVFVVSSAMKCCVWPAMLLLVGGCRVNQEKEVALYRDILDARVAPVAPPGPGARLTLPVAMALTNQNNEQLAQRGEDYVQAIITKNRIVAAFLPTVSFQPSFTIEQRAIHGGSTGTAPPGTGINTVGSVGGGGGSTVVSGTGSFTGSGNIAYRTELPVVGNISLFRGFGDVANLRTAELSIEQRRQLLLDAQSGVLLNTAQVFFQVLRSEQQVEVLRNSLKLQEARVADEKSKLEHGLSTRLAVAQTRAQAADTRARLALAEGDVANGRSVLASIMGVETAPNPLVNDVVVPAARPDEKEYESLALSGREDLRAAQAGVAAARSAVDAAISEYYPSVTLNVGGFLFRENFSDATKWNAVLSANLPLFSAGIIEADVRNAWSRLRQAALFESGLRRQVLQDVQVAWQNLRTAERRIKELQEEVDAAAEALDQARSALERGLAVFLDVLTAQDQLLTAQLLLTGAKFDRTVYYLNLLRACGRLHPGLVSATTAPATRPATRPTP